MITSFTFQVLSKSVRASQDPKLREIQDITRMCYNELQDSHIKQFCDLIETYCTHVDDFSSPLLTGDKLRLFGKRSAKELAEESLLETKRKEFLDIYIECYSDDFESTLESQWDTASSSTSTILSRLVKEPRKICFYPNATFEITFNCGNKFSQGQIALLARMPSVTEIKEFSPIPIYVAPDGCKTFPSTIDHETLIHLGWHLENITKCREHIVSLSHGIDAKRRQYGLRHRIASTIHAAMGQDLEYVVTKVTDKSNDPIYNLWDKEQAVVLLSRTNYAKNIIFVGDKKITSKALSELLIKRSQYTEYTNSMLKTLSTKSNNYDSIQSLNLNLYPYRAIDFEIPSNSCGFVYLLQSLSPYMQHSTYIGETNNLIRRVREHNQLRGSKSTNNPLLLPWALVCFITGFKSNSDSVQKLFELSWKIERDNFKTRYKRILSTEEICNISKRIMQMFRNEELRYIQCCTFNTII